MTRLPKVLTAVSLLGVSVAVSACGTQRISVPKSTPAAYNGAVLFAQRCAGCHTLSYAGTHGSAANIRDRQPINGPNFNVRCERPVSRVLYAIENGGFSGAYMPQNIVVGQDARDVAIFVATYAGRQAPAVPGTITCEQQAVGELPPATSAGVPVAAPASKSASASTGTSSTSAPASSGSSSSGTSTVSGGSSTGSSTATSTTGSTIVTTGPATPPASGGASAYGSTSTTP